MNIAEKILAAHASKQEVIPGEFIYVKVDFAFAHDLTSPITVREIMNLEAKVFDPYKVAIIADHYTPNRDVSAAAQEKFLREFSYQQGIHFFEVGRVGVEHILLPEQGLVLPGELVVGGDSHTTTYGALGAFSTGMGSTDITYAMMTGETWLKVPPSIKFIYHGKLRQWVSGKDLILYTIGKIGVDGARYAAMEFTGEAIDALSMDGRFTMANMAVEAGAKAGLFKVDDKTLEYVKPRSQRPYTIYESDSDATYSQIIEYDVASIEPQIALPHSPDNTRPLSQVKGVKIDQAFIGSCTNGRMEDLRVAARIFKDKKVHPKVRCIVIPGTQQIYLTALKEGLIETLIQAGAAVSTPTCGPCIGGHMGVLADGERCVSTTNRNFIGRMGTSKSEIYLASPAVVAASAIAGEIVSPEEILRK